MAALMRAAGLSLDKRQLDQFWTFHQFLRAQNATLNLTRIHEFGAMVVKLYIDSAIVGKLTALPTPLLDIGTGAGFPGIPLAILHPEVHFLLSEGRHQRNEFLHQVIQMLQLRNVEILGHRIGPEYERPVHGVITRAVEPIAETLHRVLRCLQPGGKAIFMKGPDCDDEIRAARKYERWYRFERDIAYRLLDTPNERRLIIYERTNLPAPRPIDAPVLASSDNPKFKAWKAALSSRGIRRQHIALAAGRAGIEILQMEPEWVAQVIVAEGMKAPPEIAGFPTTVLAKRLFAELDPVATNLPLVVVHVPTIESAVWTDLPPRCLILGLQDPNELGAVLRVAAHFGWLDVWLTEEAAHPFHPRALLAGGAAAIRLRLRDAGRTADLPDHIPGGVRLTGVGQAGPGPARIFLGSQTRPMWPTLGTTSSHDISLLPAEALAATLALSGL